MGRGQGAWAASPELQVFSGESCLTPWPAGGLLWEGGHPVSEGTCRSRSLCSRNY